MTIYELSNKISNGGMDELFSRIYRNNDMEKLRQRARYLSGAENFSRLYPKREDIHIFSVPARTEICGNHTDHQCGCVLAAAVTLDILGFVANHDEAVVRIKSEGFEPVEIDINDLSDIAEKYSKFGALTAGIISEFAKREIICGGFDAYITSDIPVGSGLSSSSAYEILICNIINNSGNGNLSVIDIAKIGQYAENEFLGKKCGLMDQLTCATGGIIRIDLRNQNEPDIHKIDFDFLQSGYSLCIVDTKGSHDNLSDDYDEIVSDMKSVAKSIGVDYLGEADEEQFYENLPEIRRICSDRAIVRATHFFAENQRAVWAAEALEGGRLAEFFGFINESGNSSAMLLQNMHSPKNREKQELMVGIAVSRKYLNGSGAVRVHGGGFAGTIQAFVPNYMVNGYIRKLDGVFGEGSTMVMGIRKENGSIIFD